MMCYKIIEQPETFENAKKTCARYGSQLVTVQSKLVDEFIFKKSPNRPREYYLWIGLRSVGFVQKWESGFKFEGVPGVEIDSTGITRNSCASYHYKFWWPRLWQIEYQSCDIPRKFVCESWKKSASSYKVLTWPFLSGNYHPVNGLVTKSGGQIYQMTSDSGKYYLYRNLYQGIIYFFLHLLNKTLQVCEHTFSAPRKIIRDRLLISYLAL